MGIESRRRTRRTVSGMVEVTDTMTDEVLGYVGNVSLGGMLLIANRALPLDALFQLRFALPDASGEVAPLETGAHVLWQDEGGAPGQRWIGLRFIGLPPDATRRLHDWTRQEPEHG